MQFNGDFHRFKPLQDFIAFKSMLNFASNQSAIDAYFKSMTLHITAKTIEEKQARKQLSDSMKEDINGSINHFGGLTIIGLCSCFEVATKDFFKSFFFSKPKSMHDYLEHRATLGSVAFDDITNSDPLDELFNVLSKRAASKAIKVHFRDVMRRVAKISRSQLIKGVSKCLEQLQKLKNNIAHEKHDQNWDVQKLEEFENVVGMGIEELCKAAKLNSMPDSYTCIAPPPLYLDDDQISVLSDIET